MSTSSYFPSRFPAMRVVWEGSIPTWMVFTGTSPESDRRTLGGLGACVDIPALEVEGSDPSERAASMVRAWSFSTAAIAADRSPRTVRTPVGVGIFMTRYP